MKIKMLVRDLDLTYGKTYDVYEIDSDGDLVVIDDIGAPNCVGKKEGVNFEVVEQEPTNDFQRAWESVWDTICNHAPKDLFNQITQDGSGIENAVELIKVLSKHYKEPIKSASTVQHLQTFTMNHKNIEISFEDGKIAAKDWRGNGEPVEYSFDMIEQLEEFMNAWEVIAGRRS